MRWPYRSLLALCSLVFALQAHAFDTATFTSSVTDPVRARDIAYTLYYPENFSGVSPLVLVSHGGIGSASGHLELSHLGTEYAEMGYIAIHVNHLASANIFIHRLDRPADVSFVIDQLEAATLPVPTAFLGSIDLTRIGHIGHSFGAYTAMSLAGGNYTHGNLGDTRVDAVVALSPQGPDTLGGFDNGPSDNTWVDIALPVYDIVGELEKDSNAIGTILVPDWRLAPFLRFEGPGDKFQSIVPGQDHGDIGGEGSPEVQAFIATESRTFFDVYVRGDTAQVCQIGSFGVNLGNLFERKADPNANLASSCPPLGSPVPSLGPGAVLLLITSLLALAVHTVRRTCGP
jgi:dienelactone hydrolase